MKKRFLAVAAVALAGAALTVPAAAVVDGTPVADGARPYVAKITVGSELSCTGTLVDPYWVITASSCLPEGKAVDIAIGRTLAGQTTGVTRQVTQVARRADRDLALARLKYPVMELPKLKLATAAATTGEVLKAVGWGRTRQTFANDALHASSFSAGTSTAGELAITGVSGTGLCKGDAGAPLVREANGVAELVAVGSRSWQGGCFGETDTRTGGTASRVDDLDSWVRQQIGGRTAMFKNRYTGRCMIQFSFEPQAGTTVKQYDCFPQYYDQAWELKPVTGGFALRNPVSDRCISARTTADTYGTTVPVQDCNAANGLQAWQVNRLSNGVQLRNAVTGLCLAVWHGTPNNGAEVTEQICEPNYADQVWEEIA
ncbi:trypsin-like serine protease [Saccharothrix sp. Mg75]|uniref:trypsin-like serine protease n=1 Tax=Saccharothrix sp. Mg75 TaxID=3445357 RepID=UPI003EEB7EBF